MISNYSVYKHTAPNGKVYIGVTGVAPKCRWANGEGYRNQIFYRAVKKYGWENINSEILFEGLNKEEAEKKEIELISYYKSNIPEYGYNIQNGGSLAGKHFDLTKKKLSNLKKGIKFSIEHKNNLSLARRGKPSSYGMLGKKMSEETKVKMSISQRGKKRTLEHINNARDARLGYKHSLETKNKISESMKGKKQSDSHKEKRSAAMRKYWEGKKSNDITANIE